ncbi:hypothetical protein [Acinetobacter sp. 'aerobic (ED)']|uniref:hypothetical protein n=1 Tax=Acinetobacter sp. 'aerobic (ED)' TaxID=174230 RepID=UPI00192B6E82|nr:hypothetical protein [Acinetobacter sp. 'aerobic (ED)']
MSRVIEYIPDPDQEEESLITAKYEAAHERRKRILKEGRDVYPIKESSTSLRFKVVSHIRS